MPKTGKPAKSIRLARALQITFLVLVILPIIVVTTVAYVNSRQALQDEIRHRLRQDATVLMRGLDSFMFERLENLRGWQRLSVMQDAQVKDVDKRLAEFLQQLKGSYGGIYTELLFVDMKGRVIASSDPADIDSDLNHLGQPLEHVQLGDTWIETMPLQLDRRSKTAVLPLRVAVQNNFGTAPLGWLYAFLDWHEVESILNRVTGGGETDAYRFAVLLDQGNHRIGQSAMARKSEPSDEDAIVSAMALQLQHQREHELQVKHAPVPPDLHSSPMGTFEISSSPTTDDGLLVGYAVSSGFQHFKGFGWRVVVVESMETAFAPIRHLLWLLLLVLLFTVIIAIVFARWLSDRIAGPIARLADYSNHCGDEHSPAAPPLEGVTEVQELNLAMTDMVARLQKSRQQLVQASKLAAVGELAATLAHEVRTPLGILRSSAQLLSGEKTLSAQGQEMVGYILSESARLNRLVTLLLESGRPRAPALVEMDLDRVIADCIALLTAKSDARRIKIQQNLQAISAGFQGDPGQLQQVFLNLLLNAIQITPEGGRISVVSKALPHKLVVDVEDTGPGVAETDREKIFEPFYSKREGGFGLGLSIVQQIVVQHGGYIVVATGKKLGGAVFRVVLPLGVTKNSRTQQPVSRNRKRKKRK